MNVTAIVSEYNPFHYGHLYQIQKIRESGATHIVAVMSGNFVQRGSLAVASKWSRAKAALSCGVDLVIELPVVWSVSTAEKFAFAAVSIIDSLGCVDNINFGSECGNIDLLKEAAIAVESDKIKNNLLENLKMGVSFAKARKLAILGSYEDKLSNVLDHPNNILAIEYIKALNKLNSNINPSTILRNGVEHDTNSICENFASASYIREQIYKGNDFKPFVPLESYNTIKSEIDNFKCPANIMNIEKAILSKFRAMTISEISNIPDISEGLENRIYKAVKYSNSLGDLYCNIKSKRYTLSRIRRIILSGYLGLNNSLYKTQVPYIRVLGFNEKGKDIIKLAKNKSKLPIVMRTSEIFKLNNMANEIFNKECISTDLYNLSLPVVGSCLEEQTRKIIRL